MLPANIERHLVSRLKIKHMKLLVTVGEQNNIFRASQLLNMAQPAVTKTIRDLENALDLTLFHRSSRGVTPTAYGEVLIKHAKLILAQVRHVSEELVSLHEGVTGHINVGTLLAASPWLLPKSVATMKEQRSNISVSITEGTSTLLQPRLLIGEIDVVVGRLPEVQDVEEVFSEPLYYEPVSLVVRSGHPLLEKGNLELKDLVDCQWIMPSEGTVLRREIENAFHEMGLQVPQNTVECVSVLTNRTLLMETDMIASMPYQVVKTYEEVNLLQRLPVHLKANLGPVGYSVQAGRELTPAVQYFLQVLKETAQGMGSDHP
jgi:DNA-binding transcriptional LysR family regulator